MIERWRTSKNPEQTTSTFLLIKKYGTEKIIIGADIKDRRIAVHGWTETTELDLFEFIQDYYSFGARQFICTDISKDGMLSGSSAELYSEIISAFPEIDLTASGGVSTIEEIRKLREMGLQGAIVGKALYEGNIKLEDLAAEIQ